MVLFCGSHNGLQYNFVHLHISHHALSIALVSFYAPKPQHLDMCTVLHPNIHQNQLKNFFCINMEEAYVN